MVPICTDHREAPRTLGDALYAPIGLCVAVKRRRDNSAIPRTAILFQVLLDYCPAGVFSSEEATVAPAGVIW